MTSNKPIWTIKALVDVLGGPTAVGKLIDQPASGVCNWSRVPRAPCKYYPLLAAALADKGFWAPMGLFNFHGVPDVIVPGHDVPSAPHYHDMVDEYRANAA